MGTSLNQDIRLGNSIFHVQTEYYSSSQKVVSNIFKDGAIVKRLEKEINSEEGVDEQVKRFHECVIKKLLSRPKRKKLEFSEEVMDDILELVSPIFGIMSSAIVQDCLLHAKSVDDFLGKLSEELTEEEAEELLPKVKALLEVHGYCGED